jgi:hypothetical protein
MKRLLKKSAMSGNGCDKPLRNLRIPKSMNAVKRSCADANNGKLLGHVLSGIVMERAFAERHVSRMPGNL